MRGYIYNIALNTGQQLSRAPILLPHTSHTLRCLPTTIGIVSPLTLELCGERVSRLSSIYEMIRLRILPGT